MTNYRYWLKPVTPQANEAIAELLNKRGESAANLETQKITVGDNEVHGVYLVPHDLITTVSHSEHKKNVRAYVQEGEGEVRIYFHYDNIGKRLNKTKPVQATKVALAALVAKKKG